MTTERTFRVMGSDAHLVVVGGPPGLIDDARSRVELLERRWSRFLADSEVTKLNENAGHSLVVSADTVMLVERSIEAWRVSAGAFDPTLLGAILRAGYDRSFDELAADAPTVSSPLGAGADYITVSSNTVQLPAGTGFDPGGIGKGLAADLVSSEIMAGGAEGVCVNLGGDVRVRGIGPEPGGVWTVAVDHPRSPTPVVLLGLNDGAVATSTTLRRAWRSGGELRHHLIDPQTGMPSTTDVGLSAVVCADAWMAEVLAKAVLLAGFDHPFDLIGGTGADAIAIGVDGAVKATDGLAAFLGGTPIPSNIDVSSNDTRR